MQANNGGVSVRLWLMFTYMYLVPGTLLRVCWSVFEFCFIRSETLDRSQPIVAAGLCIGYGRRLRIPSPAIPEDPSLNHHTCYSVHVDKENLCISFLYTAAPVF